MNAFVELPTASLIEKMSNEEYHSRPEFSSSQLKDMLRSSAHFYSNNILKEVERETKTAMSFGTLAHTLFLEPEQFEHEFIIAPKFDRRSLQIQDQAVWKSLTGCNVPIRTNTKF